jgi:hypothetical protein
MCSLLRALHKNGEVGQDGRELPDEVIWGLRDLEAPCVAAQVEHPSLARVTMDCGSTPESMSWRGVELTDDLTLLAAELRAHGEHQNWMIRAQAAQIAHLISALHLAGSERDHYHRLYQEERNRVARVASDDQSVTGTDDRSVMQANSGKGSG